MILFNSVKAAQEVAFAIRGKWDVCNRVEFVSHDYLAVKLAADLCDAEYCEIGIYCDMLNNVRISKNLLTLDFSEPQIERMAAQIADSFNQNLHSGGESFWQRAIKVAQDVASASSNR